MKIIARGEWREMISYAPLWATMEKKHATTYTLQFKGEDRKSTRLNSSHL